MNTRTYPIGGRAKYDVISVCWLFLFVSHICGGTRVVDGPFFQGFAGTCTCAVKAQIQIVVTNCSSDAIIVHNVGFAFGYCRIQEKKSTKQKSSSQ